MVWGCVLVFFHGCFGENHIHLYFFPPSPDNLIHGLNLTHFSSVSLFHLRYLAAKVLSLLCCASNPRRIICNYVTDTWAGTSSKMSGFLVLTCWGLLPSSLRGAMRRGSFFLPRAHHTGIFIVVQLSQVLLQHLAPVTRLSGNKVESNTDEQTFVWLQAPWHHRIPAWRGLERTSGDYLVQPHCRPTEMIYRKGRAQCGRNRLLSSQKKNLKRQTTKINQNPKTTTTTTTKLPPPPPNQHLTE